MDYKIYTDKNILVEEFDVLMKSVGWGEGYDHESVNRSTAAYPFIAHARSDEGRLIGYVSAFSDGVFSTMLGELVVAASCQGQGIGRLLLQAVELAYPNVPIYVKALGKAKMFFVACGYRVPTTEACVLFKKNETRVGVEVRVK